MYKHPAIGTAVLKEKHFYPNESLNEAGYPATCVYSVNDSKKWKTHYYSHCGYQEIGTKIDWAYINYSCEDLENNLIKK